MVNDGKFFKLSQLIGRSNFMFNIKESGKHFWRKEVSKQPYANARLLIFSAGCGWIKYFKILSNISILFTVLNVTTYNIYTHCRNIYKIFSIWRKLCYCVVSWDLLRSLVVSTRNRRSEETVVNYLLVNIKKEFYSYA